MKYNFFLLTGIVISAVFVSGCTQQKTAQTPAPQPTGPSQQSMAKNSEMLRAAAEGKGSVTCVMIKDGSSDSTTFMIKGKKSKTMGASMSPTKTGNGYMLNDGEYVYIWSDAEKAGIKMDFTEPLATPATGSVKPAPVGESYEDFANEDVQKKYEDSGYSYNCNDNPVADSEFVPPADVTFTDMSQMMKQSVQTNKKPAASISDAEMKEMQEALEQIKREYGQ